MQGNYFERTSGHFSLWKRVIYSMCPWILIDLCWIHAQVLLFSLVKSLRLKMCCHSFADVPHSIKYSWCAPLYLLAILISLDKFNHENQCGVSCFCPFSPPLQTVFLALIQMWPYLQIILAFMLGRIRPAFNLESLFFCIYWHLRSRSGVPLLDNRSHCNMKCPPSLPSLDIAGVEDLCCSRPWWPPTPISSPLLQLFFFCAVYAQNLPFKYFFSSTFIISRCTLILYFSLLSYQFRHVLWLI